ncbi:MAG: PAS domain S-box protein [Lentisphaerae bacterium]|nr:PAS domain S-box protein [Lentisphaerota bacterium]MCP4101756.1 PAS domain S-box protein [Lentisphaerota bacterium]
MVPQDIPGLTDQGFTAEDDQNQLCSYVARSLDLSAVGSWVIFLKTGLTVFSKTLANLLGTDKIHLPDIVHEGLISAEYYELMQENIGLTINGKKPFYKVEFQVTLPDGSNRWMRNQGNIVEYSDDGTPLVLAGITIDITKNKEHELKLLHLKRKYHELFNKSHIPMALCRIKNDLPTDFLEVNSSFAHTLKSSRAKLMKEEFYKIILPELEDMTKKEFYKKLISRVKYKFNAAYKIDKDQKIILNVFAQVFFEKDNSFMLITFENIT